MLKKSPLLAALAMVLMLSGCFEDEKKTEAPAPAAAEIAQISEGELSDAVVMDGDEELSVGITEEAKPAIDISALASGEWLLEQIRGAAVVVGSKPSFSVDAEGKTSGDTGCNRFNGESRPKPDNKISFLGMVSTKRACVDMQRSDQETKYMMALLDIKAWHVGEDSGMLHLLDAQGNDVLVFSKAPLAE
jgi:heat shock protein HslJ